MLDWKLSLVAVMQVFFSADDWFDDRCIELTDVLQRLFNDVFFGSQLIFICHMLPLTPATDLEHWARRLGSMLGRFDYLQHLRLGKVFAHIEQFDLDQITWHDPI